MIFGLLIDYRKKKLILQAMFYVFEETKTAVKLVSSAENLEASKVIHKVKIFLQSNEKIMSMDVKLKLCIDSKICSFYFSDNDVY